MPSDLIAQLCVVMWLPLFVAVWVIVTFYPPRTEKHKRK